MSRGWGWKKPDIEARTVWVLELDPVRRQEVEAVLQEAGLHVEEVSEADSPPPWRETDAVVVDVNLLPLDHPPATVLALVPPKERSAPLRALENGAHWYILTDSTWLPQLPAVLRSLWGEKDYPQPNLIYRQVMEQMEEGVALEDAEGRFVFVSPRAAEMLGYKPEEVLGQHHSLVVVPEDQNIVASETTKRPQGIASQYEVHLRHRDGSTIPAWVTGTPIFEGDRYVGSLAVFRDISREKSLQKRFQALQRVASAVGEGAHNLEEVVHHAMAALPALIQGTEGVFFAVLDEEGGGFRPLVLEQNLPQVGAYAEFLGRPLREVCLPLSKLPPEWQKRIPSGRPCISHNVEELVDQAFEPNVTTRMRERAKIETLVGLPLRSGGRLRGVILVALDQAHVRQEDLALGMAVAKLVATTLEGNVLLGQARRQMYNLDRLFELTRAIVTSMEPQELATLAIQQFIQTLDIQEASISLWDQNEDVMHLLVDLVLEEDGTFRPWEGPPVYSLEDYPATRRVMEELRPIQVLFSDPNADPQERAYMRKHGVHTLVILPLVYKGKCIGVVELEDLSRERKLSPDQMNLAMMLASQVAAALENARLFTEVQRRAIQLRTAAEVARHATGILDVETLLPQVVKLIQERFDLYYVGIFLVDDAGEWAVLRAGTGESGQRMLQEGHRLEVGGDSMIGQCTAHGEARIVLDVEQEADRFDNPILPQTRSEMALPLISRGRAIGGMTIQSTEPATFSQEDVTVLQTMADQLANAIENARLYVESHRRAEELTALNAVATRLGQSLDLQEVLDAATEEVTRVLTVEASAISLVDEQEKELVLWAQRGLHYSHLGMRIPMEKGMSGQVVRTGEMIITGDVGKDPRLAVTDFARERIKSMVLVPMHSRGRVVGVLSAMSHRPHRFAHRETTLLQAIANQVGAAVENARLYQAVRDHAKNLEKAYAQLQELDNMKDEMIQNVSHEMRTPLTFVRGYVDLLLDEEMGTLTDQQQESLGVVKRKTEHLSRLVSDIITLQTVDSETLVVEPINLGKLARAALEDCRPAADGADILLRQEIPEQLDPVLANPSRISQVFDNLLSNAIKFSPGGGEILVRLEEKEKWLQVEVSDQGIGIPRDKLSRVFDRFYQVDGSAQRRFGGAGLGLAIVKLIVEAHGGQVWAESEVGEGSSFFFTLPRVSWEMEY